MMIDLDHDRLPADIDVCIVGAGPAGITLALELADRGRRVCVLEAGGRDSDLLADLRATEADATPEESRTTGLGGTTRVWSGRCLTLDDEDFEERPWLPGSGWPLTAAELAPYYERARSYLRLEGTKADLAAREAAIAATAPFRSDLLRVEMSEIRATDFGIAHARALQRSDDIVVCAGTTACSIEHDRGRNTVTGLRVRTGRGSEHEVHARRFVLAAGGIENARLLLVSDGLAAHDLVGRGFMDHAMANVALATYEHGSLLEQMNLRAGRQVLCVLPAALVARESLLNCHGFLAPRLPHTETPAFSGPGVRALRAASLQWRRGRLAGTGPLLVEAGRSWRDVGRTVFAKARDALRPPKEFWVRVSVEAIPDPDNYVSLERGSAPDALAPATVRWTPGALARRSTERFVEIFAGEVHRCGLGTVRPLPAEEIVYHGGKHHMGTTRMHDDPAHGVVDRDCRVHGTENLYVAGSSVFPTGGHANPTMTIVALALRLADALREPAR